MNQKITFCRECTQLEPQKVQDSETTRFKWDLNWAKSLPCLPRQVLPLAFVLTVSVHCWPIPPFHFFSLTLFHTHTCTDTHLGKKTLCKRKLYHLQRSGSRLSTEDESRAPLHLSSEIQNGHGCSLGDLECSRWDSND